MLLFIYDFSLYIVHHFLTSNTYLFLSFLGMTMILSEALNYSSSHEMFGFTSQITKKDLGFWLKIIFYLF